MKNLLFVIMVAFVCAAASAQTPSAKTSREARGLPLQSRTQSAPATVPSGCNPCLWYSGDSNPANPLDDALWNCNSVAYAGVGEPSIEQIWVPFTPTSDGNSLHKHVSVTTVTFNEYTTGVPTDLDGATYQFNTFVSSGNAGTAFGKPTRCAKVSAVDTGRYGEGMEEYSYTCYLKKPIKLAVGANYWVNILPVFTNLNIAYLSDVEDMPAPNQFGWGNIYYNSYSYGDFNYPFSPTWGANGQCYGWGCDLFSIAIAGTYVP